MKYAAQTGKVVGVSLVAFLLPAICNGQSDVAWKSEDPEASELAVLKEGWAICLRNCTLIPASGREDPTLSSGPLSRGLSFLKSKGPRLQRVEYAEGVASPIQLSTAEEAARLQKEEARRFLGWPTAIPYWKDHSNTKNDLWHFRIQQHEELYYSRGQSKSVLEYLSVSDDSRRSRFAMPTWFPRIRMSSESDVGGVFTSDREDLGKESVEVKRIRAKYGANARRLHAAIDFLAPPGDFVYATMSGNAFVANYAKKEKAKNSKDGVILTTNFPMIVIASEEGITARILYVQPLDPTSKSIGSVIAGTTVVGRVDDLMRSAGYAADKIPNHVHVDLVDSKGRRFDPYFNQVLESRQEAPRTPPPADDRFQVLW